MNIKYELKSIPLGDIHSHNVSAGSLPPPVNEYLVFGECGAEEKHGVLDAQLTYEGMGGGGSDGQRLREAWAEGCRGAGPIGPQRLR